jgi:hypothetical protein
MINQELKDLIKELYRYVKGKLQFTKPVRIILKIDKNNASNPLGKTGYFDALTDKIVIYIAGRHTKDILRSLCHELWHFHQKCQGKFKDVMLSDDPQYAQNNAYLRRIEQDAFMNGNLLFRDWEDGRKNVQKP